jgi:hypothetical protein
LFFKPRIRCFYVLQVVIKKVPFKGIKGLWPTLYKWKAQMAPSSL